MSDIFGIDRCSCHDQSECDLMATVKIVTLRVWATAETRARATLDTGSRCNWMSKAVAERIGAKIEALIDVDSDMFQMMDGTAVQPLGKVQATWYRDGGQVSRVTTFLVAPHGLVDVILGAELLFRENVFTYHEFVLTLMERKLTAAEKLQQEINIKEQKKRSEAAKSKREEAKKMEEEELQKGGSASQEKGKNAVSK